MAHRDPETGQFVSGDGGGISYSDHDVHHVRHTFSSRADPSPPNLRDTQRFEITERGLDPDEIAELRQLRIHIGTFYQHDGTEDGPSVAKYEVDTGYNLSEGEFVGDSTTGSSFDPDNDNTDEYFNRVGDTDEVGQVYHEAGSMTAPQDDATNGIGTGSSFRSETIHLDMADMFGSGPFVDSADDFVSSIRLNNNRINGRLGIRLSYSLYYNVMETEDGRSRFGR